jgi:hypothetical protein
MTTTPSAVAGLALAPIGVRDRLLWASARAMAVLHQRSADDPDRCSDSRCGHGYPCLRRRLADRAITASGQGWPRTWTARHDLRSVGVRVAAVSRADPEANGPAAVDRGSMPVGAEGGAR